MHADLDTLCTVIYCTADDLLPEARSQREAPGHATPSWSRSAWRRRSWASPPIAASWRRRGSASSTSSRELPSQPAYWKRRRRLADAIEWLMGVFAAASPGFSG